MSLVCVSITALRVSALHECPPPTEHWRWGVEECWGRAQAGTETTETTGTDRALGRGWSWLHWQHVMPPIFMQTCTAPHMPHILSYLSFIWNRSILSIFTAAHRYAHAAHFVILVTYLKQATHFVIHVTRHTPAIQAAENIPTLIASFTVNNGVLNVNAEKLKFLKRAEKDLGLKLFDKCFSYLTNWAWDIIST